MKDINFIVSALGILILVFKEMEKDEKELKELISYIF